MFGRGGGGGVSFHPKMCRMMWKIYFFDVISSGKCSRQELKFHISRLPVYYWWLFDEM